MVGRLIEDHKVTALEHHLRKHTSDPFAAGNNGRFLLRFLAGEKHSAEPSSHEFLVVVVRKSRKPVYKIEIAPDEISVVILRQIGRNNRFAPFKIAARSRFVTR